MRIAALYDIHGNLGALEAVLDDIAQAQVGLIVVGGDVVSGPMPRETLTRLLNLPLPVQFIQGNGDREIVEHLAGIDDDTLPEHVKEIVQWTAQQLPAEYVQLIDSWPKTFRVELGDSNAVLFCHATPRNDMDLFTRLTPEERLIPMFEGVNESLVVCGHTHLQFDRQIGNTRVVNAGSVGMAYGEPGAYWLLLGPDVEFRRTPYNRAQAAARILATSYPQADDFAANNVVQPPSEAEALHAFT